MCRRLEYRTLGAMLCALVFVAIASAHEVSITSQSKVGNGPELQPGTYRVEVVKNQDSAVVQFLSHGDLVAQVPVTLTKEAVKCNNTEVHSEEVNGVRVITKICLQGSMEGLVFEQNTPKAE